MSATDRPSDDSKRRASRSSAGADPQVSALQDENARLRAQVSELQAQLSAARQETPF